MNHIDKTLYQRQEVLGQRQELLFSHVTELRNARVRLNLLFGGIMFVLTLILILVMQIVTGYCA